MKEWNLNTAELRAHAKEIKVGDMVNLSGTIYTARDAAHKRLFAMLDEGKDLPFDVKDAVIYYAGPTQAKPGEVIGSIGPTTSGRMDPYAPRLLDMGLVAMIGKGGPGQTGGGCHRAQWRCVFLRHRRRGRCHLRLHQKSRGAGF